MKKILKNLKKKPRFSPFPAGSEKRGRGITGNEKRGRGRGMEPKNPNPAGGDPAGTGGGEPTLLDTN